MPVGFMAKKPGGQNKVLPVSMPQGNGLVDGPWSSVPLWRGLDAAFLCEPAIPKAPPTPRIHIDSPIPCDKVSNGPPNDVVRGDGSVGKPDPATEPVLPTTRQPPRAPRASRLTRLLLLSALVGFVFGFVVAWCSGLFG